MGGDVCIPSQDEALVFRLGNASYLLFTGRISSDSLCKRYLLKLNYVKYSTPDKSGRIYRVY